MKKVLVPLAEGFEEIEAVTIIDVLRRAGVHVTVAGMTAGACKGSRRISVVPDMPLEDALKETYDMVILPGGLKGVEGLASSSRLIERIQKMKAKDQWIGAICAAPLALQKAGLTQGVKLTSHPSVKDRLTDADYSETRVVTDGKIMTSRGPGTAMEFSLAIAKVLMGAERAQEVADAMLANQ